MRRVTQVAMLVLALAAAPPLRAQDRGAALAAAAAAQIGKTLRYDPAYVRLPYPGGDVPLDRGVCTDVVVRAFRAVGLDLQRLVHEDMRGAFSAYPRLWGLQRPDPNIDHRRVPNLMIYFARQGWSLPLARDAARFRPGDVVAWRLDSGLLHIGIVGARRSPDGARPLVVHNIGAGAQEEDMVFRYTLIGHYRIGTPPAARRPVPR